MDFLIKFAQAHETFRVPEIEALALVEGLDMEIVDYSQDVCSPMNDIGQTQKLTMNSPHFVSCTLIRLNRLDVWPRDPF